MRTTTNQTGHQVEVLTPEGWRKFGFDPYDTREQAIAEMDGMRAAAPEMEWRVMPALEGS